MAAIQLTVNGATSSGAAPSPRVGVLSGTTDQYFFPASRDMMLRISDGAAAATMTIITPATLDGLAVADRTVAIPSGQVRYVGNLNPEVYGSDGRIQVTFAAADTTLRIEALRGP